MRVKLPWREVERDETLHASLMKQEHQLDKTDKNYRAEKIAVQKIVDELPHSMQLSMQAAPRQNLLGLKSFVEHCKNEPSISKEKHKKLEAIIEDINTKMEELNPNAEQSQELSKKISAPSFEDPFF